jgi:hypothetical protein
MSYVLATSRAAPTKGAPAGRPARSSGRRAAQIGACLAFALGAAACSSPDSVATGGDPDAEPTDAGGRDANGDAGPGPCIFCGSDASEEIAPLLVVKGTIDRVCASVDGCHGQGVKQLALSVGNEFAPLINVPSVEVPSMLRVKPFYPEQSYVYLKVACDGGIQGSCMPPGSMDRTLGGAFYAWIEAGAPTQ